jgi:hypothetical protein
VKTFVMLPYLQNDKQQDGDSTNVCLRFRLLLIMDGCVGQVLGKCWLCWASEVCYGVKLQHFYTLHKNNSLFKLFNHETI